jgi:hypothetical protein
MRGLNDRLQWKVATCLDLTYRRAISTTLIVEAKNVGHRRSKGYAIEKSTCHTRLQGQSRVHSICVPGSISTHMLMSQVQYIKRTMHKSVNNNYINILHFE